MAAQHPQRNPDERASELALDLRTPKHHAAVPTLRNVQRTGRLAFISGTGPAEGFDRPTGRLGEGLTTEAGYAAAEAVAVRMLQKIKAEFDTLSAVHQWIKVVGYVNAAPDYAEHSVVLNGFSDVIRSVYGSDRGVCSLTAVGVNGLPLGIAIEVDAVVELRPERD